MIKEGVKMAKRCRPNGNKRGIDKAVKSAVEGLKEVSSPVNGKEDIARAKYFS